jgi:type IV pilus assembly protein PilF
MKRAPAGLNRFLPLFWALLLMGLGLLPGCSTFQPSAASTTSSPDATSSNDTDARKRARLRMALALNYFQIGSARIALDEIKLSLAADPSFSDALALRGLVHMSLNELSLAEQSFLQALALNPRDANVMHNTAWLMCQQSRFAEAWPLFVSALASPQYGEKAKSYRLLGLCQIKAGLAPQAETSLVKSFELEPNDPLTRYNLALLVFQRQALEQARFYIRPLNNSELANSQTLWLGIKVERRLQNQDAVLQLASQLEKRFAQSTELGAYHQGKFDE